MGSTQTTRLRIGGVPEHFNLPWHQAIANGSFEAAAIDLIYTDYPQGTGAMTGALREGELDLAVVLTEGAVADILNGGRNKLVKVYVSSPLIWGLHVAAHSAFQTPHDARGSRYAISRPGSGSHLMGIVDARERGWPTDDLNFVQVGDLPGARAALASDDADLFLWEKFTTKPLVDAGEFRRIGECVVAWPAFVIAASERALARHPQAIRRTCQVINRACANLMADPEAVEVIAERYRLRPEDTQAWFESTQWSTDFCAPREALARVSSELATLGVVPSDHADPATLWYDGASGE